MNVVRLVQRVFLSVGVAMLAASVYLAHGTQRFLGRATERPGVVVELVESRSNSSNGGTSYTPRVAYTGLDGEAHQLVPGYSSNPPSHAVGEAVTVLLDPQGGQPPRLRGFMSLWFAPTLAAGLGSVFLLVGGTMAALGWRSERRANWLREHGQPVEARVEGVERNQNVRLNGRHPFVVVCQWQNPQTREVHVFRSRNLGFDPAPYLDRKLLRVFIDPQRPSRHLVDLSFLPQQAG
jgi:hypothetical protein